MGSYSLMNLVRRLVNASIQDAEGEMTSNVDEGRLIADRGGGTAKVAYDRRGLVGRGQR